MSRIVDVAVAGLIVAWLVAAGGCSTMPVTRSSTLPATQALPAEAMPVSRLDGFVQPVEGIHAGGRISAADLPAMSAAGVQHVIDLTPDEETPDFDEAAAVHAAGLRYDNLPIRGAGDLTLENVLAFDHLLAGRDGTALVHCGSGNRVGALAALRAAWLHGADDSSALEEGRRWGLRGLEDEVRERLDRERCLALAQSGDAQARCAAGG